MIENNSITYKLVIELFLLLLVHLPLFLLLSLFYQQLTINF